MVQVTTEPPARDPVPPGTPPPEPIPHWPGQLVDLPVGRLFVRCAPATEGAEPAVFVHGLGGSSTNWTDLMDLLSRPVRGHPSAPLLACAAVDLPGFGSSPPPGAGDYSIGAHATAVIQFIEEQGLGPVHLIGNSMGGTVSTRVAARRPDLVKTLALVSPALPDLRPRPLPMRLALAAIPGVGPAIMDWLRKLPAEARTDRVLRDVYTDPGIVHPTRRREEIAEVLRRDALVYANHAVVMSARSLVSEYFKLGRRSLWRDAARIKAPALILHGSHDRLVNPVMAGKAARAFPTARVMVLAGVGHVAMLERPELVAAEVRAFLDWVEASGGPAMAADRIAEQTARQPQS
ncbi:MAG TPA: alpha/beta hydrolase [Streptosporangiaceae bacterium]|jgi:pimeloyl-ACP methyl ester carboxylesterase|nr:alpha/beta hydrolase [Streptosporangiaceae bacterium]